MKRSWPLYITFPQITAVLLTTGFLVALPADGATLLVYNKNNAGAGSLRQAIQDSNALGGNQQIVISNSVTGTLALTGGPIIPTAKVDIVGPGAGVLTLSGNNSDRILSVPNLVTVSISGLTFANGYTTNASGGGGILNQGILNATNCVFTNLNSTKLGGGIMNDGNLILDRCTVRACSGASGGALNISSGGSCFAGECTFFDNTVSGGNGGAVASSGDLGMINCTIAFNTAGKGGGVFNSGHYVIVGCTISGNAAGPAAGGGGMAIIGGSGAIYSSIIAGNSTGGIAPDVWGNFESVGYNLVGKTNGAVGFGALADQLGSISSPLPALLGSLEDNGGPTLTMAPQAGSLAIDQGHDDAVGHDQRGRFRPFNNPAIPNAALGDGTDIGAFEVSPTSLVVSNLNDGGPGSLRQTIQSAGSVDGDTVIFASNLVGTITLTNGEIGISKPLTISGPSARLLAVSGNTNGRVFSILSGPVSIAGLTICNGRLVGTGGGVEQNGAEARGGGIFNQATLVLSDCILSNNAAIGGPGGPTDSGFAGGGGNGWGGSIVNIGSLNLTNCCLIANFANGGLGGIATSGGFEGNGGQGYGGAIYSAGPLTLVRSGVVKNSANGGSAGGGNGAGAGGGIYNDANITILTSTVASNSATGTTFDFGGGLYDNGTAVTIGGSTIAGNQADFGGGLSLNAVAVCSDTILAYNTAGSGPDCSGTINSGDYNLIQNIAGATLTGATSHNLTGQNPQLGVLTDNGGLSPTMAPLAGSPVLDKGKNSGPTTDQRGAPRPFDFAAIVNATGGDGSDIGAFETGSPSLTITTFANNAVLSWPSYYGGFTVQSTSNPALSNAWTTVAGTPVANGAQYFLTNSPLASAKFFRLKAN